MAFLTMQAAFLIEQIALATVAAAFLVLFFLVLSGNRPGCAFQFCRLTRMIFGSSKLSMKRRTDQ